MPKTIIVTGHEAEMAAIENADWTAKDRAIANLREAMRILESDGPSLLSQLYGTPDAPDWRETSARQYVEAALKDLS